MERNWQKVVAIGEMVREYEISEQVFGGGLKKVLQITRLTDKTLILECGCEYCIHGFGYRIDQKKLDCCRENCKARRRGKK